MYIYMCVCVCVCVCVFCVYIFINTFFYIKCSITNLKYISTTLTDFLF